MKNGFLRVAAAVPAVNVADVDANVDSIIELCELLEAKGVEIAVFPELCVTAYTCGDLFHSHPLLEAAATGIERIANRLSSMSLHAIVGTPRFIGGQVYNCAAVIRGSRVDYVAKTFIPNYNEFYERRWFEPGSCFAPRLFRSHGATFGVEICEDLWAPIPPSSTLALEGAQVMFNLSASDDLTGKYDYLLQLISQQSARCVCGYVYAGAGYGESSTDLVFDGKAIVAENGAILASNKRWERGPQYVIADIDIEAIERDRVHSTTFGDAKQLYGCNSLNDTIGIDHAERGVDYSDLDAAAYRRIDPHPFLPSDPAAMERRCTEIVNIQTAGLARRLDFIKARRLVVGISGGLDSTLALLVACRTFDSLGLDRKGIIGITMPGYGTTGRTRNNAIDLMEQLGVTSREIPIGRAVEVHFADIGHDPSVHDVTYENSQARERTQILMDVANQEGAIVLGTGDLSELALGWATYNGDHMSMYGVNAGVPKTLVKYLVEWFASNAPADEAATLRDILDTPISPELIPADPQGEIAQRTEDLVGPYELHDFFLYYVLRFGFGPRRIDFMARKAFAGVYDDATIRHWLSTFFRRFFNQQFKRSCLPDGPKVGSVCLSPRGDWRMPSDASMAVWRAELDRL